MTSKSKKKRLIILDAHALIHRSFHALPDLIGPDGSAMGAVYGVATVLIKIIRELKPTHIVAAFDRPEPTFRHAAYEGYKAQREQTPDALSQQFEKVKKLMTAFNIPIFEHPGFEADDILGTFVERFKKEKNLEIIIASGDLDTLQLVREKSVKVYTLRKGIQDTVIYDEEGVRERFGFLPVLLPDYKGLKGDPSDNIIGVKGIGDKTATELITRLGGLDEIFRALKKKNNALPWLKERIRTLLLDNEEEARFSRELATIRLDAPIDPKLEELAWNFHAEGPEKIFKEFGFRTLISRLQGVMGEKVIAVDTPPLNIQTLSPENETAFTNHIDGKNMAIVRSFDETYVLGVGTDEWSVSKEQVLRIFQKQIPQSIIGHDAKNILRSLIECGVTPPAISGETKIAEWLLRPDARSLSFSELKDAYHIQAPVYEAMESIHHEQIRKLKEYNEDRIYEMELSLIPILATMEAVGIGIDVDALKCTEHELRETLSKLEQEIFELAGTSFTILSPKQLSEILFERLQISTKGIKRTQTQAQSTGAAELEKISEAHPIVPKILEYREISKLLSTYVLTLPALADKYGRIHTTYDQAITGRLSSRDPNLQNIPAGNGRASHIRRAFVARPGYVFLACDYAQIELRVAAALSNDERMIATFKKGEDIHTATAAAIHHVDEEKVTPEMRRKAKVVNFGILFGMGQNALSQVAKISREEARTYIENYFLAYKGVAGYIDRSVSEARTKGYAETFYGRRRYLPGLKSGQFRLKAEAERMAVNMPIQGTEADIMKRAMIAIADAFSLVGRIESHQDIYMLLQIHDELVFEVKEELVPKFSNRLRTLMENASDLNVPMRVEMKAGLTLADLRPLA